MKGSWKGSHCLCREKKGQFSVEYLVAFLMFAIVILYISFQMANVIPDVLLESLSNRKESVATRVMKLLARTPENGFAEKPYQWNKTKLVGFNSSCETHYQTVKSDLGLKDYAGFRINVHTDSTQWVKCGKVRIPKGVSFGRAQTYGYVKDDKVAKIEVVVW